jgi:hypothetical protein
MQLTELKTFVDACKVERIDAKKAIPTFSNYPAKDRKAMIAHAKLVIIARAANRLANKGKVWKPNFADHNQYKYTPWFYHGAGSSGFRFGVYDVWTSRSIVGSRLCFISREVAEYVGNTFIKLYNEYFL